MGDRFLSSAGAGGNCARPMRLPDSSPVLDKNRAPMGPEILSSTGAGVWRKASMAFPDSSSVLDKFQSARKGVLTSWRDGLLRVSCTSAILFCTSATLSYTPVQQVLRSHAPRHPLHPLLATLGTFEISDPCSRHVDIALGNLCRNVEEDFLWYKFWRILPGIFLEDFSGHFFSQK